MYQYSFEKLNVWNESIEIVEFVYSMTKSFPQDEKFGLVSQMKRCSVSVASNLAEGSSRKTKNDQAHFSTIAYSSLMELLNQVIISKKLCFIENDAYLVLREKITKVANMINSLRNAQLR